MKTIKMPIELKLLGKIIQIKYKSNLKDEEGTPAYGLCHINKSLIEISTTLVKTEKMYHSVLLHELMHFIIGKFGLSEILSQYTNNGELEEAVVVLLEETLPDLVRLNRKKWIKTIKLTVEE